jgi:hypothetical protein
VRIPAGTYPGQVETARTFESVIRLLARHSIPKELAQILVYQISCQALLSGGWVGQTGHGHWVWCVSAVPRLIFRGGVATE